MDRWHGWMPAVWLRNFRLLSELPFGVFFSSLSPHLRGIGHPLASGRSRARRQWLTASGAMALSSSPSPIPLLSRALLRWARRILTYIPTNARARAHTHSHSHYIPSYLHVYPPTHLPTCLPTYPTFLPSLLACLPAYPPIHLCDPRPARHATPSSCRDR